MFKYFFKYIEIHHESEKANHIVVFFLSHTIVCWRYKAGVRL